MYRAFIGQVVTVTLLLTVAALVLGQLLGQPVLLGFVTSNSMAPTIDTGDGFVAIPQPIAGDVQEGDVVVFHALELEGGGLTTHRVAGTTADGYVTKGDNNAFTDQDGDEPPVTENRIVATALQVNGRVVSVPGVGSGLVAVRDASTRLQVTVASLLGIGGVAGDVGAGALLFLLGLGVFVATTLAEWRDDSRDYSRSVVPKGTVDGRYAALALLAIVLVPANAAMIGPSGTQGIVADGDRLADDVVPGEPLDNEFTARNDGAVAMFVTFTVDDPAASMAPSSLQLPAAGTASATLTAPAPPPGDRQVVAVTERRYLLLLPPGVLETLHERHPVLPWVAINLLLAVSALGIVGGAIGLRRTRVRDTGRDVPVRIALRRWLRRRVRPEPTSLRATASRPTDSEPTTERTVQHPTTERFE